MSYCNLDAVNMYCWTHGVDIDEADYAEGYCSTGWWEHENEEDREDSEGDDDWRYSSDDSDDRR